MRKTNMITEELITMMITQLPNFTGFIIMAILLVWQTKKAWSLADKIIDRCVPDGDCLDMLRENHD